MAEEKRRRTQKPERQDWTPHWSLTLLYKIWMVVFGAFKIVLGAAATVVLICGVCIMVFAGALGDYLEEDILPNARIYLEDFTLDKPSYILYLDKDGNIQTQQKIHAQVHSVWADYEDIPENLIHATIAIEDKRFYEHQGVDWITTIKACAGMFFGDADKGGSTITQQLVKNTTDDNSFTVQRKVLEIFRATDLEKRYSKDTIMEQYLNRIYLGRRCNGVRSAAAKYFGKELEMLTLAECASLISITNNPSLYDPYGGEFQFRDHGVIDGYARNAIRKTDTLNEMLSQGWITQEEYDEAMAQVLILKDGIDLEDRMALCENEDCAYKGLVSTYTKNKSSYYCPKCNTKAPITEDSTQEVYSWHSDTVVEEVAMALAEKNGVTWGSKEVRDYYMELISRSGYYIYSTIDMDVQKQVDKIYTNLDEIPDARSGQQLESAIVVMDNRTGDIVAIAGAVGLKTLHDPLNIATDSELQSGSSIKPLSIYAPAFEMGGFSPATVIKDLPQRYNGSTGWPRNVNRKYNYSSTVYTGVVDSINAVAANTLEQIGTGYAYSFAKDKFGLSTLVESITIGGELRSDIDYAPLAMGAQTVGITVRDMAAAFGTFANDGVYREARTFTKVYDSEGNLVIDNTQDTRQILSKKSVDYMNYCLEGVVKSGSGTAARLNNVTVYGKTGSTTSNKDRWFCGFTGYYTAAVWCGYREPEEIILVGNGSNPAARLFKKVMQPLHTGKSNIRLYDSGKLVEVEICLDSGLLATDACKHDIRTGGGFSRVEKVRVYREDRPKKACDVHVEVDYCSEGKACANEYCKLFAEENLTDLSKVCLVKMTVQEFDEVKKASKTGLTGEYTRNDYIYLVNKNGTDAAFKGFNNDVNKNVEAPYQVCTKHTKASWEEFVNALWPVIPGLPEDPDSGTVVG